MTNSEIIFQFYRSLAKGDIEEMLAYYRDDVVFKDAVFGELHGEDAKNMWRMLVKRSKGNLKITCENIQAEEFNGSATWQATYYFGKGRRKVVNRIRAQFEFKDGKIIRHSDSFNFWNWSRQALGWKGFLMGWTPFFQDIVRNESLKQLKSFSEGPQKATKPHVSARKIQE